MSSKRLTVDKFIPMYLAAVDAGMTREDFAKKIGVSPETLYQRVYDLNKNHEADLPLLPVAAKHTLRDAVKAAKEAYYSSKKTARKTDELDALLTN